MRNSTPKPHPKADITPPKKVKTESDISGHKDSYFASCPTGLENLLLEEIKGILGKGALDIHPAIGGVLFSCKIEGLFQVLLRSRVASRLYQQLYTFPMEEEKDLYHYGIRIDWKKIFDVKQTFKIQCLLARPGRDESRKYNNSIFLSQKLKDAIADRFRKDCYKRPDVAKDRPADVSILLRVSNNEADVLIDLCGTPLSNRGYRQESFSAPIRENLAAAIIMLTDWKPEEEIFVDSMCGSGTFLIEAAFIKAGISPTHIKLKHYFEAKRRYHPFNFLHLPLFRDNAETMVAWEKAAKAIHDINMKAMEVLTNSHDSGIYGSDISKRALEVCRQNLAICHLSSAIPLSKRDATKITPPEQAQGKTGIILCNPPYGERLSAANTSEGNYEAQAAMPSEDDERLKELYYEYGENLKNNWKNFRAYIFTGNPELRKKVSLRTTSRVELKNGNIECRLLRYNLY